MIIGLTGGIGAGKSTVAAIMARQGAFVVDADEAAREVSQPGTSGFKRLKSAFGAGVISADGTLDRAALAKIVFGDAAKLSKLNNILHPLIFDNVIRRIERKRAEGFRGIVVLEAALLLDSRLYELADAVWVVYAADDVRINRVIARNGCTAEQAKLRVMSQKPQSELIERADVTIDSGCALDELESKVNKLIEETDAQSGR